MCAYGRSKDGAWPAPTGEIRSDGAGRPAPAWMVSELPEFILVKGKQIAVRGTVQRGMLVDAVAVPTPTPVDVNTIHPAVAENDMSMPSGAMEIRGLRRKPVTGSELNDNDRAYRDSALILCSSVDDIVFATGLSVSRACHELASRILLGDVSPELIRAEQTTYLKPRKTGQTIGGLASRLSKLYSAQLKGVRIGNPTAFLVPGKRERGGFNPIWIDSLLKFYCHPHRPSVKQAWESQVIHLKGLGLDVPSYSTAVKIIDDLPVSVKYRRRATGSAWKELMPYVGRDVSMFRANDIWVCDGSTFKAKVRHPEHGKPFQPEVTFVIDWVSRKIVGWSIGLSESMITVSEAFRHAQIQTRARPLVYYTDNGGGQSNRVFDHEIYGTLTRQGISHQTGIPGNPQARGVIERLWKTTITPLAQRYPSCIWRGADQNTVRKNLVRLGRKGEEAIVASGAPSWAQFLDDIAGVVNQYNYEHRHSSLGGKSPEEVYQDKIDTSSIVFGPNDDEINALWMPEYLRTPRRGLVKLFGNFYFNSDLVGALSEGESVRVRYDMHEPEKVWLYRESGEFVCEAKWNAHVREAFAVSQVEDARRRRVERMVKRGERIIADAQAELVHTLEHHEPNCIDGDLIDIRQVELSNRKEEPIDAQLLGFNPRECDVSDELYCDQALQHQSSMEALFAGYEQLRREVDDEDGDPTLCVGAA